jgi:D-3-phosphoglycerate dehydrogenase
MQTVFITHPTHKFDTNFGQTALAQLQKIARVRCNPTQDDLEGEALLQLIQGCAVVIAYRQTPFDRQVLAAMQKVVAVVRCAVDIRTIDVDAASAQGILVTQASPGFGPAVAEWVLGAMVDLARGISQARAIYQSGEFPIAPMGRQLRGAHLGVVGYGHIGRNVCRIAQSFGMHVSAYDPFVTSSDEGVQMLDLPELLAQSDFVVCLAVANAATENLFNTSMFAKMKRGAFFINPSRGNLVDEDALMHALESGHLAGAALDVGRAPDQMPSPSLAKHPLVIATPHIGGLTPQAIEHQAIETVAQTEQILRGLAPTGSVNTVAAKRLSRLSLNS